MPLTLHLSLLCVWLPLGWGKWTVFKACRRHAKKKNLRHFHFWAYFSSYLCPMARDGAFWNTSCASMLWFSIIFVHTIFLMDHSSSGALNKFDKGNRGPNQTTAPLYLTLKYPVDDLVIDSCQNCRERHWAVTATAKPAYCTISAVSV